MNIFVAALAELCAERRFEEKRLVAPSRRIGNQWMDAAARAGRPVLNLRVETLRSLAVGLAAPALARDGLAVAPRRAEVLLVERLLRVLLPGRLRYLCAAAPGPGLAASVLASLSELRVHGVPKGRLRAGVLEDRDKAADLCLLAARYETLLTEEGLADYALVLRAAAGRIAEDPGALGGDTLVLIPEDVVPNALERCLLDALPEGRLVRLAVDQPGLPQRVGFTCAVGEGNEVRGVLRACLEGGLPLDEVEVLHTGPEYPQAFVEVLAALDRPGADSTADVVADAPVTFAEGLPCALSRPGRALAAWMRWMAGGYPQGSLVAMIREGLLETGAADGEEHIGLSRLAALLRSIPIGQGRERYLEKIDERTRAARVLLDGVGADAALVTASGLEQSPEERRERLGRSLAALQRLRGIVSRLLEISPPADADGVALVEAARSFLARCTRTAGRFDDFAAERLRDELDEMAHWLGRVDGGVCEDVSAWLAALPAATRVVGSGPRPGCLHVDHLRSGGHSGRPHTFVVGLDDSRFPGAGLQDPLLLDAERRRIDPALPTAAARLEETVRDFWRLLGRLRGAVTLSWPSRAVVEDAECFPSQAVLNVLRSVRGTPEADQRDLLLAAGPPASFSPGRPQSVLDPGEWRLWRFTGELAVDNASEVLARRAPHIARGLLAANGRASDAFTPWDGRVPLAGVDLDPASQTGMVLSSNGLETVGACPRRFFYRYALDIAPPEELVADPGRWLDPLSTGSLLHELFEEYVRGVVGSGRPADFERGRVLILSVLERKLKEYRAKYPVPSLAVFSRERDLLVRAAETFVREDSLHALETGSEPVYLEASLGMPSGDHTTELDQPEAVPVELPDGTSIRTRGRIDRIDRLAASGGGWAIWDYKTGSSRGFDRAEPFPEGRKIQPYLYARMVERRLRAAGDPDAAVRSFGYFFPGARGRGERITWGAARLAGGAEVLASLCAIVASGAFVATTDAGKDCRWCDYRPACGDVAAQAAASKRKILAAEPLLAPMGRLRGLAPGAFEKA